MKEELTEFDVIARTLEHREITRVMMALKKVDQPAGKTFIGHVAHLVGHGNKIVAGAALKAIAKFRHPTAAAVHMVEVRPNFDDLLDDEKVLTTEGKPESVRLTALERELMSQVEAALKPYGIKGKSNAIRFALVHTALMLQKGQMSDDY